jgi:hypothetical protein
MKTTVLRCNGLSEISKPPYRLWTSVALSEAVNTRFPIIYIIRQMEIKR